MSKAGKAKEWLALGESALSYRRRRSRHVHKGYFINLRDPSGCQQDVGGIDAKAVAMVTGKSDCLVVPVKRVMIAEGRGQQKG